MTRYLLPFLFLATGAMAQVTLNTTPPMVVPNASVTVYVNPETGACEEWWRAGFRCVKTVREADEIVKQLDQRHAP
jgi:hypothetical protein